MRTVLKYENGRAIWSENEPASASIAGIRGSLVSGEHGPVEQARISSRVGNATAKAKKAAAA